MPLINTRPFKPDIPAWDLSAFSYDGVSFSIGQDTTPLGIAMKTDGTKMYISGAENNSVYQYTLSTPWDVGGGSASYDSVSLDVTLQDGTPNAMSWRDDGTRFFLLGSINDFVYQYNLTVAWDLNTASYASLSKDVNPPETSPGGLHVRPDGSNFYLGGTGSGGDLYEFSLSSAWFVNSATYTSVNKPTQGSGPTDIFMSPDGTKLFHNETSGGGDIHQYTLSTPWSLNTLSFDSISLDVSTEDAVPRGLHFRPDGRRLWIVGLVNDTVYQYSAS